MTDYQDRETLGLVGGTCLLCLLIVAALLYSNEMAIVLFGVLFYLFVLLCPLLWFLFRRNCVPRKRPHYVRTKY